MEKKLNLKKVGVFTLCVLVAVFVIYYFISSTVRTANYKKTYDYKLTEIGYTENEITVIKDSLSDNQIEELLKKKYDVNIVKLLKEKYFLYKNLDKYLSYLKDNKNTEISKAVAKVNVGSDKKWYSSVTLTDISKGVLVLVNKFNGLSETYKPEDLKEVPMTYAYSGNFVSEVMYDDLISMLSTARENGYTLVVSEGFRSYEEQENAYNNIENYSGKEAAEEKAARAGHSEYQTGLSVIIGPYNKNLDEEVNSLEHEWLVNNSYKYGFILRYEEGKEEITGFKPDAWRFRYVGVDTATEIHNERITFDEYYAYYIESKGVLK